MFTSQKSQHQVLEWSKLDGHQIFWSHRLVMRRLRGGGARPCPGRASGVGAVPSPSLPISVAGVPCCTALGAGSAWEAVTSLASLVPALRGVLIKGINLLSVQGCCLPIYRADQENATIASDSAYKSCAVRWFSFPQTPFFFFFKLLERCFSTPGFSSQGEHSWEESGVSCDTC